MFENKLLRKTFGVKRETKLPESGESYTMLRYRHYTVPYISLSPAQPKVARLPASLSASVLGMGGVVIFPELFRVFRFR